MVKNGSVYLIAVAKIGSKTSHQILMTDSRIISYKYQTLLMDLNAPIQLKLEPICNPVKIAGSVGHKQVKQC